MGNPDGSLKHPPKPKKVKVVSTPGQDNSKAKAEQHKEEVLQRQLMEQMQEEGVLKGGESALGQDTHNHHEVLHRLAYHF